MANIFDSTGQNIKIQLKYLLSGSLAKCERKGLNISNFSLSQQVKAFF